MKMAPCITNPSPERPDAGRKSAAYEGWMTPLPAFWASKTR